MTPGEWADVLEAGQNRLTEYAFGCEEQAEAARAANQRRAAALEKEARSINPLWNALDGMVEALRKLDTAQSTDAPG